MIDELRTAGASAKDPSSYSLLTYVWIICLAMLGGVVRVLREVDLRRKTGKQIIVTFLTEIIISSFVGLLTFYACRAADLSFFTTALMTGVSGHMGVRALGVFESVFKSKFQQGEPNGQER